MTEILVSVEFQMSLLLSVALAGYLVALRFGQPAVIMIIVLGLLVGPSFLGWITYTGFVSDAAHLGAVVLLFVVGLRFRIREILTLRYGIIALSGVVVSWVGGYFLAKGFGFDTRSAMLIGSALTATSIAITVDTFREIGQLGSVAAKAVIGAAVMDDVLSLIALDVVELSVSGNMDWLSVVVSFLKVIGFVVIATLIGKFVLSRYITWLDGSPVAQKYPGFVFAFAMLTAFVYAMAAEALGSSAIFGAFIAGLSLEGVGVRVSRNFRDGADYLRIIFASVFFVSLGVLVDIRVLTPELLWFTLALTGVATLTKLLGCALPAYGFGMSLRDELTVGIGMVPRGEVAMAIGLIGLNQHLIGQPVYVAVILMSLLTTLLTPFVLRNWLIKPAFPEGATHGQV